MLPAVELGLYMADRIDLQHGQQEAMNIKPK
jgi:hypothetical protein